MKAGAVVLTCEQKTKPLRRKEIHQGSTSQTRGRSGWPLAFWWVAATLLALLVALPALAVQPDEMLDDPALEARAREISQELRCLVCRNESIDESNADLARDLRLLVRERLVAGDTDAEVKQFLVARYGEFVLLKPRFSAANAALYLFPAVAFLGGLGVVVVYLRRRGRPGSRPEPAPLNEEERRRLDSILGR
jgi:cytochrome c-type biogenesis protein CcmH